jgi:hypothetical protein
MKEPGRQKEEISKLNTHTEREGRRKTAQVDDTTDLQLSDKIVSTVILP